MRSITYGCGVCEEKFTQTALGRFLHTLVRHQRWLTGSGIGREWNRRWGDLAQYNSERARGIIHDPETDARMAKKQAAYPYIPDAREED